MRKYTKDKIYHEEKKSVICHIKPRKTKITAINYDYSKDP